MIIDGVQIDFGIIDQTINKDFNEGKMTGIASSNSPYSNVNNTINVIAPQPKIAYLEQDYFLLDGSFTLPEENEEYNVGYESGKVADENGDIEEWVEYTFENAHVSYGIQLNFRYDCIAKNFKIEFFKDNELLNTIIVEDNNLTRWTTYEAVLDWNKVRITFTKVNVGQRARLSEITFGLNEHYTEDNLIEVQATRRTDISGDYNDCGDFSFTFFNEKLDMLNVKGLAMGLMEWLRTTIWVKYHGNSYYTQFGEYYSETADVQLNGKVVNITGYDGLYKLNESWYRLGKVYESGRSLGGWAREVAEDAGIDLIIDPIFDEIISYGYITDVPHREALRLIAEAGNGILVVEPTGEIHLKKFIANDMGELTDDYIVDGSLSIENPEKILGVDITAYTFLMKKKYWENEGEYKEDTVELSYIEEVGLTENTQTFDITYGTYPVYIGEITVGKEKIMTPQIFVDTTNTNAKITRIERYADHIIFDISMMSPSDPDYNPNKTQNYTWVTITGRPYNTVATNITRGSTAKNVKKITENFLITNNENTINLGEAVADYQYGAVARKYNYRAETVLDDIIDIEDKVVIQKNDVLIEGVGFRISYGEHAVSIEGIDENEQTRK